MNTYKTMSSLHESEQSDSKPLALAMQVDTVCLNHNTVSLRWIKGQCLQHNKCCHWPVDGEIDEICAS